MLLEEAIAPGLAFAVRFNGGSLDFLRPEDVSDTALRWELWEEEEIDVPFAPDEMRHPDMYQRSKTPINETFFEATQSRPLAEIRPFRIWADLNRRAFLLGVPGDVRYAAAFEAVKTLVIEAVSSTHTLPASLEELERAAFLRLLNLEPAANPAEANLRLAWDGVQAYLVEITYPSSLTCSTVIYLTELVDWEAAYFEAPRYAYDQHVGREWQPLGAWILTANPDLPS